VAESDNPEMLTTTDVAGRLGYSEEHVRRLCEAGHFDGDGTTPGAFRLGVGAHWRIPVTAVEHFLASSRPKVLRRGSATRIR
jgi:hypothetical protein